MGLVVTAAGAAGCEPSQPGPRERVRIVTDAVSEGRAGDGKRHDRAFPLRNLKGDVVETGMGLTWLGAVDAPEVEGITLQATDVAWRGHHVVATYAVAGDTFRGAVQVIDATKPEAPKVVAEAIYPGTDLSRVRVSGSRVVASAGDHELGGTLEQLSLKGDDLSYDGHAEVGSWFATFVELKGSLAYVTSGDVGGAISLVDIAGGDPVVERTLPLHDARWVSPLPGQSLVAVAGSPARIVRIDGLNEDAPTETSALVPGGDVGAPTWASLRHDDLYVSADRAGVLVYDAEELAPVGSLATDGDANGSAVATDGRIAFFANGDAGLVVADVLDPSEPFVVASFDVADDGGSANAVALQGKLVALADGRAGVKLFSFEREVEPSKPKGDDEADGGGKGDKGKGGKDDKDDDEGDEGAGGKDGEGNAKGEKGGKDDGPKPDEPDCDADGIPDLLDPDDDDDRVLDEDDAALHDPDLVCEAGALPYAASFLADVFELPCEHPDVGAAAALLPKGALPSDRDWFAPSRFTLSAELDALAVEQAADLGLAPNRCGSFTPFAARHVTTLVATKAGFYGLSLAAAGEAWLFVDGELRAAVGIGGAGEATAQAAVSIDLAPGPHKVVLWQAARAPGRAGLALAVTSTPSAKARLLPAQHVCLDPAGDADRDGSPNVDDLAPFARP